MPPISGPFGDIVGPFTGNFASHGYIKTDASIMSNPDTEQHFRMTSSSCGRYETTTIQYSLGSKSSKAKSTKAAKHGHVYYSTIPMDFYLANGRAPYPNIIYPNALCYFNNPSSKAGKSAKTKSGKSTSGIDRLDGIQSMSYVYEESLGGADPIPVKNDDDVSMKNDDDMSMVFPW